MACFVFADGYLGQGNSFHGTGGRGNKRAQMRHCLRLMRSIVSTEDEVVIQDLADQGAINQLIGQFSSLSFLDLTLVILTHLVMCDRRLATITYVTCYL